MKLFELHASGPTAGDCTAPYDVVFRNECTVREFIDEVLRKNEWGFIRIFDGPYIEYRNDKITYGDFGTNIFDSKINKATAHGGWTRMDYTLDIQPGERTLRNEYARTLKEIVRHESEIEKLKERIRNLKDQLASFEASKTPKPQLDKESVY
jgi:hypothetical protein